MNPINTDEKIKKSEENLEKPPIQEKITEQHSEIKKKIDYILNHWLTTLIMTTFTLYALFADDFRMVLTDKVTRFYFTLKELRFWIYLC